MKTLVKTTYKADHTKVNGFNCRAVTIQGLKYLVLHDLIATFGRKFLNYLLIDPVMYRVSDGSNSQNRKLITITQFRNARQAQMEGDGKKITSATSKKPRTTRIEAEQSVFPFEKVATQEPVKEPVQPRKPVSCNTESQNPVKFDISKVTIDPVSVRKAGVDNPKEQKAPATAEQLLRIKINSIVDNYAILYAIKAKRTEDVEYGRIKSMCYTTMYDEFDRQIELALRETGKKLSDYGLGLEARINMAQKNNKRNNYMQAIEELGCLPQLLVVAKQMFETPPK